MDKEKLEALLKSNHAEYIKKPMMIGFTYSFPEDPNKIDDEITISANCAGHRVSFKVRYGDVTFGDGKFSCKGITTDQCLFVVMEKPKMVISMDMDGVMSHNSHDNCKHCGGSNWKATKHGEQCNYCGTFK